MCWSSCEALTCWEERGGHARKLSRRPELSSAVPCFACKTPATNAKTKHGSAARPQISPAEVWDSDGNPVQAKDPIVYPPSARTAREPAYMPSIDPCRNGGCRLRHASGQSARAPHRQEELAQARLALSCNADAGTAALPHPLQPNSSGALSGRILSVGRMDGRNFLTEERCSETICFCSLHSAAPRRPHENREAHKQQYRKMAEYLRHS